MNAKNLNEYILTKIIEYLDRDQPKCKHCIIDEYKCDRCNRKTHFCEYHGEWFLCRMCEDRICPDCVLFKRTNWHVFEYCRQCYEKSN